jgi:phosphatidylinositol alpha 1,6-mannosyltransferase
MRVAIVTESFLPSLNGVTNSVLRVIDTLTHAGYEVAVFAPTSQGSTFRGVPVTTCPSVVLGGFPIAIPTPALAAALEAFGPDVIHVAAPFWMGGEAIAWADRRGIPSVAVYQTDVAGYMKRYGLDFATPIIDAITANIHRLATLNLVPTPLGEEYLRGLGVGSIDLWGRGVDLELFHPSRRASAAVGALRRRWAPDGEVLIGYVGRLAPEKQVGRMVELCEIPNTRIVIVGDGPDRVELEERFQGHPVTFTGQLSGEALADTYAAMDIFVHCGTEETFGQTIQEAHASGLAVVAPNSGGPRHLVRHGDTGYLVDATRWGAFREAVAVLVEHKPLRVQMATRARESVLGKSWEANNQQLLVHYRRALEMKHSDSRSVAA